MGDGTIFGSVAIPGPGGSGQGTPTGIVANTTGQFDLSDSQPALFLFDTEDGTVYGWNFDDGGTAEQVVDNSGSGAVYKGLALGTNPIGVFIYATNFHAGTVDVFDNTFSPAVLPGSFTDPHLPLGYAPFGIANINGDLIVTYAQQDPNKHDDVAGQGHGFVDVFDTSGHLVRRLATRGQSNSPWGITQASLNFGVFSGNLLIGNFGDGRINAFDLARSNFLGQLRDPKNKPITIDGLWSILPGGGAVSSADTLYFTAGPNDEADGLFGTLNPE